MRAKQLLILGAAGAVLLSLVAVLAAVFELWWLLAAAVMLLGSASFLTALDASRRVSALRAHTGKELKRIRSEIAATPVVTTPATAQDVTGTVRVLQAQYTARLDRMHAAIEHAVGFLEGRERRDVTADEHGAD